MVGTGVFTTTGFLVRDLRSAPAVLIAWTLGGLAALAGALTFAELGAALPHNGGEYRLLGRIYHPGVGFVAGWISLIVGFAAPIAASAIAFGDYLQHVVPLPALALWGFVLAGPTWIGIALIALMSVVHILRLQTGTGLQDALTFLKIALIVALIVAGFGGLSSASLVAAERPLSEAVLSPELGVGLVYVAYAYSGWNAAIYVGGEVLSPARSLPIALALGTGLVTALYLGLNVFFVGAAPAGQLAGQVEVAQIAAIHAFGHEAARWIATLVALGLLSTVGALVMTGARVSEAMGEDYARLSFLKLRRVGGGPVTAIVLQAGLAIAMALTASFDTLLRYIGLTLTLVAALTAAGVYVLRLREPELERPYRVTGYPFTPLAFLALAAWMIVHTALQDPWVGLGSAVTLLSGGLVYAALRRPHA